MSEATISVPIEARSIFRVLAIGKVVTNHELVCTLCKRFNEILDAIPVSERITNCKKHSDILGYTKFHNGSNYQENIEKMPETHMCKSPKVFFNRSCITKSEPEEKITFIDYQIPLNNTRDSGEGVIDLLGVSGKKVYIVEVKKWHSDEHPLRAMFEALTFWKLVQDGTDNGSHFVERYNTSKSKPNELPKGKLEILPAILVREGSSIYKQMMGGPDFKVPPSCIEPYKSLYRKIRDNTQLTCFCYDNTITADKPSITNFTAEFDSLLNGT